MSRWATIVAVLVLAAGLQVQAQIRDGAGDRRVPGDIPGPFASLGDPEQATHPHPSDGRVGVWRDTGLNWTPGESAQKHDVYFGAVFNDVNEASRANPRGVLVGRNQVGVGYDPGRLEFATTYHWRVDEVDGSFGGAISRGQVWTFTTEAYGERIGEVTVQASSSQPGADAERTIDGSGLNEDDAHTVSQSAMWLSGVGPSAWLQYSFDKPYKLHEMWVWNYNASSETVLGFGLKDVAVEYSQDQIHWSVLGDFEFARASARGDYTPNTVVGFGGVIARHVRVTAHSNWGGSAQSGLSEVRFLRVPVRARGPEPVHKAKGVDVSAALRWEPGREAAWHELYISTDSAAVIGGAALVDVVTEPRFPLASLDLGQTYYWRVDEVNQAKSPASWTGNLWSFTTQEYMAIDDFESYDNDKNRIYDTWIDGYNISQNGSLVGHLDAPFAEQTIVRGGLQSMPLFYDNGGSAARSEVEVTWSAPQNWIARGADTLLLFVRGAAGNDPEPLYIAIEDNAGRHVVLTHPDSRVVTKADWQPWHIPFSELGAVGMYMTSISKLAIGLGDRDNPTPGGSGVIYIDDILIGRPLTDQ